MSDQVLFCMRAATCQRLQRWQCCSGVDWSTTFVQLSRELLDGSPLVVIVQTFMVTRGRILRTLFLYHHVFVILKCI